MRGQLTLEKVLGELREKPYVGKSAWGGKVPGELREKLMLEKVPWEVRGTLMLEKVSGELRGKTK